MSKPDISRVCGVQLQVLFKGFHEIFGLSSIAAPVYSGAAIIRPDLRVLILCIITNCYQTY